MMVSQHKIEAAYVMNWHRQTTVRRRELLWKQRALYNPNLNQQQSICISNAAEMITLLSFLPWKKSEQRFSCVILASQLTIVRIETQDTVAVCWKVIYYGTKIMIETTRRWRRLTLLKMQICQNVSHYPAYPVKQRKVKNKFIDTIFFFLLGLNL